MLLKANVKIKQNKEKLKRESKLATLPSIIAILGGGSSGVSLNFNMAPFMPDWL